MGIAKEYVVAMWKMLQQKRPKDYVISTGKTFNIKHFINLATDYLGLKLNGKEKALEKSL